MTDRPDMRGVRVPPHSVEAEQSLLGAVMLSADGYSEVSGWIDERDFYRPVHRLIWRAVGELVGANEPTDAVTVADWFQRKGELEQVDGGAYLTMLANETPGPSNIRGYAGIVREKARLRQLVEMGSRIADQAMSQQPSSEILQSAERELMGAAPRQIGGPRTIPEIAGEWLDHLDALAKGEQQVLSTGLVDLDKLITGLLPAKLYVIAGRPGMGKSAAGMTLASHVAREAWVSVWSGEMKDTELLQRMVATQVNGDHLKDPRKMTRDDWAGVTAWLHQGRRLKMMIDDTAGLSIEQIALRTRRLHKTHPLGLVVIDYLQLVNARAENRTQEVSKISRGLKQLAKDLDVPVIALTQLNRDLERRPNKRPMLSDLRESGQLEQDADVVIFLYQEGAYDKDETSGLAEWIVGKQRGGPTGEALIRWIPHKTQFVNADYTDQHEYWSRLRAKKVPTGKRGFVADTG